MSPAANCDRSGRDLGRACGTTHARQTGEASNVTNGGRGNKKGSAEGRLDTDTTVGTEVLRQQRHDAKTNMDGVQNLPAHLQGEFMKTIEQMQTKDSLT